MDLLNKMYSVHMLSKVSTQNIITMDFGQRSAKFTFVIPKPSANPESAIWKQVSLSSEIALR